MTEFSRITTLARQILDNATVLEAYCKDNNVKPPSFDVDGPAHFQVPPSHPQAAAAQAGLLAETLELNLLVSGPTSMLMNSDIDDTVCLQAIYRFNVAKAVPLDRAISYEDLSATCGINGSDLRRIIRMAATKHIFKESRPGFVEHTAASKVLAENQLIHDFVGILSEEKFKAAAFTVDALSKWNVAEDPTQSGFSLGHDTEKGLYLELQAHPERARRWANAMSHFASRISLEPLFASFDWSSLGHATVVDVGGGHGPVSVGLAAKFPNLQFVVQDFPDVVASRPTIAPELVQRIQYMGRDVLSEQPIKGAAIYFSRAVFHNLPDTQCVQLLQHNVKAMGPSSLILINESLLHEPGSVPAWANRQKRKMDMSMLSYFGSRERNKEDWERLLLQADSRLELKRVMQPVAGANHTLIIGFKA